MALIAVLLYCFVAAVFTAAFYIFLIRGSQRNRHKPRDGVDYGAIEEKAVRALHLAEEDLKAGQPVAFHGSFKIDEKATAALYGEGEKPFVPQMGDHPLRPFSMNDFTDLGFMFSERNRIAQRANDLYEKMIERTPVKDRPLTSGEEAWVAKTLKNLTDGEKKDV